MKKTSVYLTEEEADALRRAARSTGRSQTQLIREGIHQVLLASGVIERQFHSMGAGEGTGQPYHHWDPDDLYRHVMGRE